MRGYYIIFGIAIERWRATYVTAIPGGAFWRGILELIFHKALSGGVLIKIVVHSCEVIVPGYRLDGQFWIAVPELAVFCGPSLPEVYPVFILLSQHQ
jgi:hypothetical protein